MTTILGFLGSRWGFAAIGALALVLMYGAWSIQVGRLRGDISEEQQKTRIVQSQFDAYKLQVEQQITNQERIRADENRAALDERERLQGEVDRLRGVAQAAERRRNEATTHLLEALRHAPQTDVAPLAAATLAYLDGVRRAQGAGAADNPTPPGN